MSDAGSTTSATHTVASHADTSGAASSLDFGRDELVVKSLYKLSEDLSKYFDKSEDCDINLEIGKEPDIKKFSAHSSILRARSVYFNKALSKKGDKNDDTVSYIYTALSTFVSSSTGDDTIIFKKENVTPKIFKIILDYMYGGIGGTGFAKLSELSSPEVLNLLETCCELGVSGYEDYFQQYFLQNHDEWIRQNLLDLEKFTVKYEVFREIRSYCLDQLCQNPDIVFKPNDIKSISKDVITALLSRDDLIADETDLWNFIIKWGIAQDPEAFNNKPSVSEWTEEDFAKLKTIMGDLVPLIRFKWVSHKNFFEQARPYKLVFERGHYENVMQSYFIREHQQQTAAPTLASIKTDVSATKSEVQTPSTPIDTPMDKADPEKVAILLEKQPRARIDVNLIVNDYISLISSWIDKKPYNPDYKTYKFKLLYRGSDNKFSCTKFHQKCGSETKTLTIARIKDTNELIGGYNPVGWKIAGYSANTTYSITSKKTFIFKIEKDHVESSICSRVVDHHSAIRHRADTGPNFFDLVFFNNKKPLRYHKVYYEKDLEFEGRNLEDYEVYKVLPVIQ